MVNMLVSVGLFCIFFGMGSTPSESFVPAPDTEDWCQTTSILVQLYAYTTVAWAVVKIVGAGRSEIPSFGAVLGAYLVGWIIPWAYTVIVVIFDKDSHPVNEMCIVHDTGDLVSHYVAPIGVYFLIGLVYYIRALRTVPSGELAPASWGIFDILLFLAFGALLIVVANGGSDAMVYTALILVLVMGVVFFFEVKGSRRSTLSPRVDVIQMSNTGGRPEIGAPVIMKYSEEPGPSMV